MINYNNKNTPKLPESPKIDQMENKEKTDIRCKKSLSTALERSDELLRKAEQVAARRV